MHGHESGNGNVLYNFPVDNYLVSGDSAMHGTHYTMHGMHGMHYW